METKGIVQCFKCNKFTDTSPDGRYCQEHSDQVVSPGDVLAQQLIEQLRDFHFQRGVDWAIDNWTKLLPIEEIQRVARENV